MPGIEMSKNPTPEPANPEIGKPFKLTAEVTRDPAGHISVWWTKDDAPVEGTKKTEVSPTGPVEVTLDISAFADTDYGVYKVAAAESDTTTSIDLGDQAAIEVAKPVPDPAPAGDAAKEELRDLVWDKNFAAATGTFVGLGLLLFGVLCSIGFVRSIAGAVDGTGFASVVLFTGLFLGIAAVMVGGWLIGLEMRGRAPIDADAPAGDPVSEDKGIVTDAADGASKVLSVIGRMTGPVALLAVGLLIFAGTAWLAFASDDANRPQPPAASTTTTEL